jgi:hypothetical protein
MDLPHLAGIPGAVLPVKKAGRAFAARRCDFHGGRRVVEGDGLTAEAGTSPTQRPPMKNVLRFILPAAALTLSSGAAFASNEPAAPPASSAPGYVDFGALVPSAEGKFVEVNLPEGLLKFAAALTAKQEPQAADVIRNLRHVQVNVIELSDANRAGTVERVQAIRHELEGRGWSQIVNVREPPKGDDVQIYAKTRGEEAVEGLVVTVISGTREVVLVNIVGDIKPDQIATLAERFNIEPLKKIGPVKPKAS